MTIQTANINQKLATLTSNRHEEGRIAIDNFRHLYLQFPERFVWPDITVTGIQTPEAEAIIEVLVRTIPSFIAGCSLLPEPRPRRESSHLHLVRLHQIHERHYLYLIKISAEYFGGAQNSEIVSTPSQGRTPSFYTDRIYYAARLFPVQVIERDLTGISDFEALTIRETAFQVRKKHDGEPGELFTSALFDDIDFGRTENTFADLFGCGGEWKGGKLIRPFVIDYLTLCLHPVVPDREFIDFVAPFFDTAFQRLITGGSLETLDERNQNFWRSYYGQWKTEPFFSRAGNPHWLITDYPTVDNLPNM